VVEAFAHRDDTTARAHGDRLTRLYPDLIPQAAAAVLADLDRRERLGTVGRPATAFPVGLDGWDDRRKAAYLIDRLDEISAPDGQDSDPTEHLTVRALIDLGDPAVPVLLDAAERETRLTRFVEHQRSPLDRDEQPVEVRDLAAQAVRRIVRVTNLEPLREEESDDRTAAGQLGRLRRYWAAYGHLGFTDRMMAVLTNPSARPEARAEAADRLARHVPPGWSSWSRRSVPVRPAPLSDRAAVIAAILEAIDTERTRPGRRRRPNSEERLFLRALVELGDPQAGLELARRAGEETSVRARVAYAQAAHRLGASGPLVGVARELAAGMLLMPPRRGGSPSRAAVPDTLAEVLESLGRCGLPEADEALYALADPTHPYFRVLIRDLLAGDTPASARWMHHPFCLSVLRAALTDPRPTGSHYYLRGDEVEMLGRTTKSRQPLPARALGWHEHVEERAADAAALQLSRLVVGVPEPHPLRPNADRVLADMRATLLRYEGHFRILTLDERSRLGHAHLEIVFGPDIKPLGRPATAADVRAGRAVFELNGNGRLADGPVPVWVQLKGDGEDSAWGRAVQAEVGPGGKAVYGVIFRHAIRSVKADDVERVEP
jgi:hypothetical protein